MMKKPFFTLMLDRRPQEDVIQQNSSPGVGQKPLWFALDAPSGTVICRVLTWSLLPICFSTHTLLFSGEPVLSAAETGVSSFAASFLPRSSSERAATPAG